MNHPKTTADISLPLLVERVRASRLLRSIGILAKGTAIAQAVTLLATPALTRLYTPEDYGVLALFTALVSSMTPAICGRFEIAIVVAKPEPHARQLFGLCLLVASGVSAICFLSIVVFWEHAVALLDASNLGFWLAVVPVALFLGGATATFNGYANRRGDYNKIATSMLLQNCIAVAAMLLLGMLGFDSAGLLLGALTGSLYVCVWLAIQYRQNLSLHLLAWNDRKRAIARAYRDFPIFNASTALLDGIQLALPVFFITRYFPDSVVGYYALIVRIVQAPLSFISNAVLQVHLREASVLVHRKEPVRPYLLKLTLMLAGVALPFAVVLIVVAPDLFAWAFGETWREAGLYARILTPSLALRFVVSTVSSTFGATGHNHLAAVWKITAFLATAGMFVFIAPGLAIQEIFVAIVCTDVALYCFYYVLIWHAAGHPRGRR